jgi:choline dehydrogenase-like flavoprotein
MEHTTGSYDFVVMGTGTTGCVLAARLPESGAVRVLPLEAGSHWRRCPCLRPGRLCRAHRRAGRRHGGADRSANTNATG